MKILWISGNPSMYSQHKKGYNNGGWIASLESVLAAHANIDLGVCFFYDDDIFKTKIGNTTYYPINVYNTKAKKILHNLFYEKYDKFEILKIQRVVDDFKPDVIHVWGTEQSFGLVKLHTTVPVIIHIQGLLGPIYNTFLIPSISRFSYILHNESGILRFFKNIQTLRIWKHNVNREQSIIESNLFYMGRTDWDKAIINFLNPKAKYFICNELLRPEFYTAKTWSINHERKRITIVSTISQVLYKGFDLILKTAKILKTKNIDFEWKVIGLTRFEFVEKHFGTSSQDLNIKFKGVIGVIELINELIDADLYVHSSYIDNSPNSVCEAQILGVPVIATNVGGVSSIVENNVSGILVPANDPFYLAAKLIDLSEGYDKRNILSKNAKLAAIERHDYDKNLDCILKIYSHFISSKLED